MSTVRRPLTAFDLPVLEHLHADSFPEDPWSARSFGELLALPGVSGLLTQAPEEPVGFLLWRRAADEAEVLTLCVQSAARRRGLAASMLRVAMASLKRSGTQRLLRKTTLRRENFTEACDSAKSGAGLATIAGVVGRRLMRFCSKSV